MFRLAILGGEVYCGAAEKWVRANEYHGSGTGILVLTTYVWDGKPVNRITCDLTAEQREALDPVLAETLLALEYARNPPYGDIE